MSSRKKAGGALSIENFTSMAPRCASTAGAIDSTCAAKRWSANASATTLALCPTRNWSKNRSSTWATSWVGPASARLSSALPGCTICPGSTWRVSTRALAGAVTWACASRACAVAMVARAWSSCACACTTSVPASILASAWACALVCWARATSSARRTSSRREALIKPCPTSCWLRISSACAARKVASACITPARADDLPVLRSPARRA